MAVCQRSGSVLQQGRPQGHKYWGLIGVAIGTLVSMLYQTVWMAWFNTRNMLNRPMRFFIKQICVDALSFIVLWIIPFPFRLKNLTYAAWIILAIKYSLVFIIIIGLINIFFYKDYMKYFINQLIRRTNK